MPLVRLQRIADRQNWRVLIQSFKRDAEDIIIYVFIQDLVTTTGTLFVAGVNGDIFARGNFTCFFE